MLRIILGLVGLSAVLASAVSAQPPFASNEFRFIGFTDTLPNTIDGGQGMIAMHELCQDDFGPNSRMCTSEEFWLSPNAEAPAADAWLHPVFLEERSLDFSGVEQANSTLSCAGWTSIGDATPGLVVTTAGKSAVRSTFGFSCNVARPVTCCAPIQ